MKLLRFHLSTLLLLCVFTGSVMGLWLRRDVWQLQYSAKMGAENGGFLDVCKQHAPWVLGKEKLIQDPPRPGGTYMSMGIEVSNNLSEWSEVNRNQRAVRLSLHDRSSATLNNVFQAELPTESEILWWAYSDDKNYLAIVGYYHVTVYYRTRSYGWAGFLELPLFWVALVSLLGLGVGFGRWVFNLHGKS